MKFFSIFTKSIRRTYKKKKRALLLTKRQQFIAVTGVLTTGLLLTQLVPPEWRFVMVSLLTLFTYTLTAIVLIEDLKGIEWVTLLFLPSLFTMGVSLFYFLLPVRWLTRLPVVLFYAVGIYALLLTENIYNVAVNRTIALLRAAHSVGFLLSVVTFFLLIQTVLAFHLPLPLYMVLVCAVSGALVFPALWGMDLEPTASRRVSAISGALTVLLSQLGWSFYFWPVNPTLIALFLTTVFYGTVGMAQQYLQEKLYRKTIVEFSSVVTILLFLVFLATRWRGFQ